VNETEEMARLRQDLEQTGMHQAAALVGRAERLVAQMQAAISQDQDKAEITRLWAVIRHALPHQTNQEVARWLRVAAEAPGAAIQDDKGRRIDQSP
jgi:histidine ammonia-lyase